MKLKTFLKIILGLVIILAAAFFYLYLTRSKLLFNLPLLPKRQAAPVFLCSFGDIPGPDRLKRPMALTFDGLGALHVSDFETGAVRVFSREGEYLYSYGNTGTEENRLQAPYGLGYYNGRIYVSDNRARRVAVYSEKGEFLRLFMESGKGAAGVFIPTALAVNPQNGDIYIADVYGHRVLVANQKGDLVFTVGGGGGGRGELNYPNGVALDGKGNIYIADSGNARVQVFSPDGKKVERVIGGTGGTKAMSVPRGLVVDEQGFLWLVDVLLHTVNVYSGGSWLFELGRLGTDEGELYFPNGLAMAGDGTLFVAERGHGRISVFGYRFNITRQ